jgi:phage protein D
VDVATLEETHRDFFAPTFVVKIAGDDLVRDLFLTVASVSVDLKENAAGHFKLTVTNAFDWEHREFTAGKGEERVALLELFQFGAEVKIQMGYGEPANLPKPIFEGTVSELSTTFGSGGAPQLEISGYDKLFPLTIGKSVRQWRGVPDSEAVKEIAGIHGLEPLVTDTSPEKPVIDQNEETDLAFLEKLAKRNSAIFYAHDGKLYFGPRQQSLEAEIKLAWGGGLTSFSPEVNLANQIAAVEVYGTSTEEGTEVMGRAEQGSEDGRDPGDESGPERLAQALSGGPVLRVRAAVNTQAEADARAQAILRERAQQFLKGSADCIGLPELRPDINVKFSGLGKGFSKTYWIAGAVHDISGAGYTTSLTVQEPSI